MKHVRLELTADGSESEIHPMYDLLANASFVDRVKTTHTVRRYGDMLTVLMS